MSTTRNFLSREGLLITLSLPLLFERPGEEEIRLEVLKEVDNHYHVDQVS